MKIMLLLFWSGCGLLVGGCASCCGECKTGSAAGTSSSVYDPATDTTTMTDGGYTVKVLGNHSNEVWRMEKAD